MQMCWKSPSNIRPTMANVLEMVSYINSNQKKTDNFESKWNSLLPTEKLVTNLPCEIDVSFDSQIFVEEFLKI